MKSIIIEQPAKADIAHALRWYREIRHGLESDFILCVDETLERIRRYPGAHPEFFNGLRRALTHRFPYGIFYIEKPSAIHVLAVLHTHRDPQIWPVTGG